jgi:RNA polymerase sigma factor (sigma-70 family)
MGDSAPRPFKFLCSVEFVREFERGDRAALQQVYVAYLDEVEATVRRCMAAAAPASHRRFEDVRDLVQDVFVRAFSSRARRSFDSSRDYGPFLGALTRNLLIDRMRQGGREVRVADLESVAEAPGETAEDPSLDAETVAAVRRYLSELPTALRAVHEQRYVLGHPQQVACAALGLSRQRLRTLEGRLRAGLERELKRRALHLRPAPRDRMKKPQPRTEPAT